MKVAALFLSLLLAACSVGSGILPAGPDTFTVTERRAPILGGALKAKEVALTEANAHCAGRGETFVPVSERESAFPPGNPWGNTDYTVTFRCVSAASSPSTTSSRPSVPSVLNAASASTEPVGRRPIVAMPTHLRIATLRPTELFKIISPSVYLVAATNDLKNGSQGSAVAISPSVLITNCHVVANYRLVFLMRDKQIGTATLASENPRSDMCFLQTHDLKLVPVRGVRSFGSIEVGEEVFALGNPRELELTFSPGIISAKRRDEGVDLLQTTAPIAPGSSGGGLFDARGNLLGITTFLFKGEGNLNFAISADAFWR